MQVNFKTENYEYIINCTRGCGRTLALAKGLESIGGGYLIVRQDTLKSCRDLQKDFPNVNFMGDGELHKLYGVLDKIPVLVDNSVYDEVLVNYETTKKEIESYTNLCNNLGNANMKLRDKNKELHNRLELYEDFFSGVINGIKEMRRTKVKEE